MDSSSMGLTELVAILVHSQGIMGNHMAQGCMACSSATWGLIFSKDKYAMGDGRVGSRPKASGVLVGQDVEERCVCVGTV